jgi:polyamine oxidase
MVSTRKSKPMNYSVIVIGAGVAGLVAASKLQDQGLKVLVVEAADYVGGRVRSIKWRGHIIDLGASFVHGVDDIKVDEMMVEIGAKLTPFDFYTPFDYFDNFLQFIKSKKYDEHTSAHTAANDYIAHKNLNVTQQFAFRQELRSNIVLEYGADLSEISANAVWQEPHISGGDFFVEGGYDVLPKHLAKNLDIKLKTPVTNIRQNKQAVEVSLSNGDVLTARFVICTVSLGALKEGVINFEPNLPHVKRQAINTMNMGNLSKTYLLFKNKFWGNTPVINTNYNGMFQEFLDLTPIYNAPILVAFHGGHEADSLEGMTKSQIMARTKKSLANKYPDASAPISVLNSFWTSSKSFGSYSYVPTHATFSNFEILAEPYKRVYFAGEHTSSKAPFTVGGAYLSGLEAAKEVYIKIKDELEVC